MREAVIVSTARTPIGKAYRGAFNATPTPTLGGHVIRHAVERAGVEAEEIDDVVMGTAIQMGTAFQNPARQSLVRAGLPVTVAGLSVDRQCASGMMAMPSTPYDAKGMMKAAIRDNNPVVMPWHMGLMMDRGPVPETDYIVPLGLADVKREGSDVTVLANSIQLKNALQVADKLANEISIEVIDPRSFKPFDMDTLLASLEKTNRLVIVDEDWERGGVAATISA